MTSGSVAVTETDHETVLSVYGDLDLHGAPTLRARLRRALADSTGAVVVVDLSEVGVVDDIGVGVLLGLRRLAASDERRLVVRHTGANSTVIDELGVGDLLSEA